jgi:UDP-N-acetylglucosamine diphosphorylase/glucosamine-1-phosphate N-acetyltransferase
MNHVAPQPAPEAIILAAGKGTRMGGDLPKVVHEVAGQPMVKWVVRACKAAGVARCVVVVGYKHELVRDALATEASSSMAIEFVEQTEQLGTGHATRMAEPLFQDRPEVDVFVLAGDGPLIRPATLQSLLTLHRNQHASATLATAVLDDPSGYGRVVRNADSSFSAIIEQKDASEAQLAIREVNPSYYCFVSGDLFASLAQVRNDNRQREYYLTDVPALLKSRGKRVCVVDAVPPADVLSINTPDQLAAVDAVLRSRLSCAGADQMKESV